jgi:GNAT superfamily N-acetyltransferase
MEIREIKENEIDYLWNFEKENRVYDEKVLGKKFWPFFISKINKEEKREWLKEIKKSFKKESVKIFVVEEDNELLGYAWINTYFLEYLKPNKKVGYINEFFLTEKARGRKISTKLMNEIMRWFKEKNIEFVSLCVFSGNKEVVEIYKKFGFEPFSTYMRKKI